MILLQLFWVFASLSLIAVGGANAVIPEMHRQIVEIHGWMDHARFVQLYALAQAAPGPNILTAGAMGYHVAGIPGMVVASIGIVGPAAVLAWIVAGLTMRLRGATWLKAVQGGLVPVAIGLFMASGIIIGTTNGAGSWVLLAITAATTVFIWRTSWNPLWVLGGGGLAGLLLGV